MGRKIVYDLPRSDFTPETINHCHSNDTRGYVRHREIASIKSCVAFFKAYENTLNTKDDKADLAATIAGDEALLEEYQEIKDQAIKRQDMLSCCAIS